jgi:hypothetical protein
MRRNTLRLPLLELSERKEKKLESTQKSIKYRPTMCGMQHKYWNTNYNKQYPTLFKKRSL